MIGFSPEVAIHVRFVTTNPAPKLPTSRSASRENRSRSGNGRRTKPRALLVPRATSPTASETTPRPPSACAVAVT